MVLIMASFFDLHFSGDYITNIQTDNQTNIHTDNQTDKNRDCQMKRQAYRLSNEHSSMQTDN